MKLIKKLKTFEELQKEEFELQEKLAEWDEQDDDYGDSLDEDTEPEEKLNEDDYDN